MTDVHSPHTRSSLLDLASQRSHEGLLVADELWVWVQEAQVWYQLEGANEGYALPASEFEEYRAEAWLEAQLA